MGLVARSNSITKRALYGKVNNRFTFGGLVITGPKPNPINRLAEEEMGLELPEDKKRRRNEVGLGKESEYMITEDVIDVATSISNGKEDDKGCGKKVVDFQTARV